jgi:hypothetical protein
MILDGGTGLKPRWPVSYLRIDFAFLNAGLHDSFPLWMSVDPHPMFEQGRMELFIHPSINTIVSKMSRLPLYIRIERAIRTQMQRIS